MFDNGKAPHVHNKSIMCHFIFIQSILLSHCELNTIFFLGLRYKGYLFFLSLSIWQTCIWKKGSFSVNKPGFSSA